MNLSLLMELFYPGEPIFKARHRTRIVQGKGGKAFAQTYTPKETREGEQSFAEFVRQAMPSGFFIRNTPIFAHLTVMRVKPKSKKKHEHYPEGKPDWDNHCKAILDSLNGVVYDDDSHVVGVEGWKVYADRPGVYLKLYRVDGPRFDAEDIQDMIGCKPLFDLSQAF